MCSEMEKPNHPSTRPTAKTATAFLWLILAGSSMVRAYAEPPVAPPQNGDAAAANAGDQAGRSTDDAASDPASMFPHFKSTRFWLSGQMNFIFQTHPDFH